MPTITIYQKPTCTTCRKVHAALVEEGVDFNAVDYYIDPISREKLKELLSKMKITALELLRQREPIYKELGLDKKNIDEEKIIDLMVKYPDLIQRPIVERGGRAVLARPAERISEILSEPGEGA